MTKRATTEEEFNHIVEAWHCGVGEGPLHEALGWTENEYGRYMNASNGATAGIGSGEDPAGVLESFKLTNASPSLVPVKVVVEQEGHSDIEVGPFNQGVAIEIKDFQFISVIDVASSKTCLTLPINAPASINAPADGRARP